MPITAEIDEVINADNIKIVISIYLKLIINFIFLFSYVNLVMVEIDVKTLNQKILENDDFILLDVRNDSEVLLSKIDKSIHIPMKDIPSRISELDKTKEIVVQCKLGIRSAKVCEFLLNNQFSNVKNLKGGIAAWSKEIDPSIIVY